MSAPLCACCSKPRRKRSGQPGWKGAHGNCEACDRRWRAAGCPEDGPPPPMSAQDRTARSSRTLALARAARLAEYARLRDCGWGIAEAARDIGVTVKTAARKYEPQYWRQQPEEEVA